MHTQDPKPKQPQQSHKHWQPTEHISSQQLGVQQARVTEDLVSCHKGWRKSISVDAVAAGMYQENVLHMVKHAATAKGKIIIPNVVSRKWGIRKVDTVEDGDIFLDTVTVDAVKTENSD